MGCVAQAVLEFDEEVQAPWRPRLVPGGVDATAVRPLRPHSSPRSSSRVGVCRPGERAAGPGIPVRRGVPGPGVRVQAPGAPSARPMQRRRAVPAPPDAVRLRITRRARRLGAVLALAAGVAIGAWLGPLVSGGDGGDLRLAGVESVVVEPGDTLWSIATSLNSDGDVRAVVDRIQELNQLESGELLPGQVLQLP